MSVIAITRPVSPSINRCELTHLERRPIDLQLAERQHEAYERALVQAGCSVLRLPVEPDLPDSVFVEDAAIILDEAAFITRPGAESRQPEVESVAQALAPLRSLLRLEAPATLDGGDVLRVGKMIFVGLSSRSGMQAVEQMRALLGPLGYRVQGVNVSGCLHLKSAVSQAGEDTLLVNPRWVAPASFPGFQFIEVDAEEPGAANGLLVQGRFLYASAFPRTAARLQAAGVDVHLLDMSETAKAEGAMTCCSLIVPVENSTGAL